MRSHLATDFRASHEPVRTTSRMVVGVVRALVFFSERVVP